ncbi:MAG TPA: POTRA domain-containing protein, partial [Vicinamibacterales bacterium]|nr:POTRA domain-containing protein [Vicinamibacterales bacterium]
MIAGLVLALVVSGFSQTASPEVITDIRVQGNVLTPDAEMIGLTGVAIGAPFTPDLPQQISDRLKATHKFETVQVLKRYASIEDPSKVLLVVIVNEGPVKLEVFKGAEDETNPVRVVKRHGFGTLWLPLLDYEDGYGWS